MIDYAKLAEVLGVELGDAFYTQDCPDICNRGTFKITRDGIKRIYDNALVNIQHRGQYEDSNDIKNYFATIGALVAGRGNMLFCYTSKFNDGDEYWSYAGNDWSITKYTWSGSLEDLARANMKATFKKQYMALHNRPNIYKNITGKEWIEP